MDVTVSLPNRLDKCVEDVDADEVLKVIRGIRGCLTDAFCWASTHQGHGYWSSRLRGESPLSSADLAYLMQIYIGAVGLGKPTLTSVEMGILNAANSMLSTENSGALKAVEALLSHLNEMTDGLIKRTMDGSASSYSFDDEIRDLRDGVGMSPLNRAALSKLAEEAEVSA